MADLRDDRPDGSPAVATVPGTLVGAVAVTFLEAAALIGVAVVVLVETVVGTPEDLLGSLLQAGLCLVGAAVLAACGRSLRALQTGARTPLLVLQLLALPVAYSLWFQGDGHPQYGAPIAIAALVTIFLLFAPPSRLALDRPEE